MIRADRPAPTSATHAATSDTPIDVVRLTFDAWNGPHWIVAESRPAEKRIHWNEAMDVGSKRCHRRWNLYWYIYIYIFLRFFFSAFVSPRRCVIGISPFFLFSISFFLFFSFSLYAHTTNVLVGRCIPRALVSFPCLLLITRTSASKYRNSNSVLAE